MRRIYLLLGLAVLISSSVAAQQPARKASGNSPAQSDLKPVYQRWLGEDVAYIITPEEKRAFLMLSSDDQREQFIDVFWRRRDTNPATRENEYRSEHYARIAYANQNFAFGDVAGWQTDRGRIYITHGKPDEIRKSTSGEVWLYRYAPGLGHNIEVEFVDVNGTGNYRLRLPNHP
ncbi:MAG TPA: GWxTD domain-containing protein [Pyrinomonadaceae bacterium]|jgi:GWxTD domain-containing protein